MESLKLVLTNPRTKERVEALQDINSVVGSLDPRSLKVLLVQLAKSLFVYSGKQWQSAVESLLDKVLATHGEEGGKALVAVLGGLATEVSNRPVLVKVAMNGLRWCERGVASRAVGPDTPTWSVFIAATSSLYCCVVTHGNHRLSAAASRTVSHMLRVVKAECFLEVLVARDPTWPNLLLVSAVCGVSAKRGSPLDPAYVDKLVAMFLSVAVAAKTKPPITAVEHCHPLLSMATEDHLTQLVQPAVKRALLRSPEHCLEGVAKMCQLLSIDLDVIAVDLGTTLCSLLDSTHESQRHGAVVVFRCLSVKCGSTQVAQDLVALLTERIAASKRAGADQRSAFVTVHGCLSECRGVTAEVASQAASNLVTLLQSEMHEGVLMSLVQSLSSWLDHTNNRDLPAHTVGLYKKLLSNKASGSGIKMAVYQSLLRIPGSPCVEEFKGHIKQVLEKSKAAAAEGVLPALLVHKNRKSLGSLMDLLHTFTHSEVLTSDKFVHSASHTVLVALAQLTAAVLLGEIPGNKGVWSHCGVWLLVHPSWEVRHGSQPHLAAALEADSEVLDAFLTELEKLADRESTALEQGKSHDSSTAEDHRSSAPFIKQTLTWMCTLNLPNKEHMAVNMFPLCTHPTVDGVHCGLWSSLVQRLGLHPPAVVKVHKNKLIAQALSAHSRTPLATLVLTHEDTVIPVVMDEVLKVLSDKAVVGVTLEEVEVLDTPPGQLQDKGLYQELMAALTSAHVDSNMRKESKLYSIDEQRWEAELKVEQTRKRLAEFRGRSVRDLLKVGEASRRLKDTVLARLDEEEQTRQRLTQLMSKVELMVSSLHVVLDHTHNPLLLSLPQLVNVIIDGLRSPLLERILQEVWVKVTVATMRKGAQETGRLLGWMTLQLLFPKSTRRRSWEEGHVTTALGLLLHLLEQEVATPLHWYCPALPLLRHVLLLGKGCWRTADILTKSVSLIHSASQCLKLCTAEDAAIFPTAETLELVASLLVMEDATLQTRSAQEQLTTVHTQLCQGVADMGPTPSILQVMIEGLSSPMYNVRFTSLSGLYELQSHLAMEGTVGLQLVAWILICCHDSNEELAKMATKLWEETSMSLSSELEVTLITVLSSPLCHTHTPAAKSLAELVQKQPQSDRRVVDQLLKEYGLLYKDISPICDEVGRVISVEQPDPWEGRVGVARALEHLSAHLTSAVALHVLRFMIPQGLGDRHSDVRAAMLGAGLAMLDTHRQGLSGEVMKTCEEFLLRADDSQQTDLVRKSVMVLMGTMAKHLDQADPKVVTIVRQLLANLDTPSQSVQEAISSCLPPLMGAMRDEAQDIIDSLMEKLLESKLYAQRKGAAYGIAGVVKGFGIPSLKQFGVMQALKTAVEDRKNYRHREGALCAVEQLTVALGRLFEPYVVHLLPNLLHCYGDGNQYVREATVGASRAIMARLSGHGVKLILPDLLKGLQDDSWRTKAGSAELLGAMAFCAPKQLSSCLPSIVPRLAQVLNDSHVKVQGAGNEALKQIGSVIKNPEIQELVPDLLTAISDPSAQANICLQRLLATEFVHVIDAPSLALIMPILQQTLSLRSSEGKKMAAQIMGNMYSLTDHKDLSPYLPGVLPGLKEALLDPVPEVRGSAARALGAMVKGLGQESMSDLLPWLFSMLQSEGSSVDRSGAAQGLSEVIKAQGADHLDSVMPKFVEAVMSMDTSPQVRDGYLMLFIYLPMAMEEDFLPHVGPIIPCILQGLADENEFVRDTALRAGQGVVNRYADTAMQLFLPQLQKGFTDANWRIRYSSIQLLGDLLYCISGLSGKMSTVSEEDENFGTEEARRLLIVKLGLERRNDVLAGLYMGRSDVALMVRQISLHVWKVVVTNTPRTLREILPQLLAVVLGSLTSELHDHRQVAARTLGDLVRKMGHRVLPEVVPLLEERLHSDSQQERQGVCIGLSEIVKCTDMESVQEYAPSLLAPVCRSLVDTAPEVRAAAAETFASLHSSLGNKILDDILPTILTALDDDERHELALDALRQTMKVKSKALLPYLVPKLVTPPINTKALAVLSSVAGDALQRFLPKIVPALLAAAEEHTSEPDHESWQAAESIVLSMTDEACVSELINQLCTAASDITVARRQVALRLLLVLCHDGEADLQDHTHMLIGFFLNALNDPDETAAELAWDTLAAIVKHQDQKDLPGYISSVHRTTRTLVTQLKGRELHGFTRKGIDPVLSILKEALFKGSQEEREEAALALTNIIKLASVAVLTAKTNVIQIAGPLIRLVSDRWGWMVKVATLDALVELVQKVGSAAKAVFPQLQTSYIKALSEPNQTVRQRAKRGLVEMMSYAVRTDPVFNELHKGIKNSEDPAIRSTQLQTLLAVTLTRGESASPKVLTDISKTLTSLLQATEDSTRVDAGQALGALCSCLPEEEVEVVLETILKVPDDKGCLQGHVAALSRALETALDRMVVLGVTGSVGPVVMAAMTSEQIALLTVGVSCATRCFVHLPRLRADLIPHLLVCFSHEMFDVRTAVCDACGYLGKNSTEASVDRHVAAIVAALLESRRERNPAVKTSADQSLSTFKLEVLDRCQSFLAPGDTARLQEWTKSK